MRHTIFQRILLAVDESPCTVHVLEYVKTFLKEYATSLAIVTVIPPTSSVNYGVDPLLGQLPVIVPEITEIQEVTAQQQLEDIATEFKHFAEVFTFTKIGNVRDEILNTAQEWTADLIILGTNGRTGLDHFISGSVAESVVRKSHCPVLVIPSNCD